MRSLSDPDIVRIWEIGQQQHPLDRALTCLAFVHPERSLAGLANLTIGQRDALLLMVRERTFGAKLDSVARCPKCQEQLEFALSTRDIRVIDPDFSNALPSQPERQYEMDGLTLHFRLPTSVDLATAATMAAPPEQIRTHLAQRCLLKASQGNQAVAIEHVSEEAIAQLAQHLATADPQAEILLDLQCPACQYKWQMLFDIVSYLWSEISAYAKRLLIDVHRLAQAYGWHEADILAMSNTRRQYYLDLVG